MALDGVYQVVSSKCFCERFLRRHARRPGKTNSQPRVRLQIHAQSKRFSSLSLMPRDNLAALADHNKAFTRLRIYDSGYSWVQD